MSARDVWTRYGVETWRGQYTRQWMAFASGRLVKARSLEELAALLGGLLRTPARHRDGRWAPGVA